MSLRTAIRPLRAPVAQATRALSTSAPRRGGHSDSHSSSEADTHESFFSGPWLLRYGLVLGGIALYNVLPALPKGSASPSVSNDSLKADLENPKTPWLTRVIASRTEGNADTWKERSDKHLELSREAADQRLLFQEAERPKVWRLRYPGSFDQASPHAIGVGSQADLSDLKVKNEGE